jgi:pyridoxal phosphate enzyme (YggS family)
MQSAADINFAIQAGVDAVAENKPQEFRDKNDLLLPCPRHFIGHLQTNKIKYLIGKIQLYHSCDRMELIEMLAKQSLAKGLVSDILLQINIAKEETKGGFTTDEVWQILQSMDNYPNVFVRGLMAIPPVCQKSGDNDKFFQEMCRLAVDITAKTSDNVSMDIMSMGMSDDFADAIRCGSTMIRVGTAIFGPRNYTTSHP